jgi:hypothetical protein
MRLLFSKPDPTWTTSIPTGITENLGEWIKQI